MEVTIIGIVALGLGGLGFVLGDRVMILMVAAFMPLEVAAAINLPSGLSILCVQMLLILALGRAVLASYSTSGNIVIPPLPLSGVLLLFLIFYSVISSYFFPRMLTGITDVFSLQRGLRITALTPLAPSSGNITQPLYLFSDALLFLLTYFAVKADYRMGFRIVAVIAGVTGFFALLDIAATFVPLSAIWDQIRTANYSIMPSQTVNGIRRVIGGNAEPSSFSTLAVSLFGFYASLFLSGSQQRHLLAAGAFLLLTLMALASTGFSALAAVGVALGAGVAARFIARGVGRQVLIIAMILVPIAAVIGLVIANTPPAMDFIERVLNQLIFGKLETSSGEERLSWTRQGLTNFMDTYGLGVGLGSNRSNGLLAVALSQVGAPGTALLFAFIMTSFMRSLTRTNERTREPAAALFRASRTAAFAIFVAGMASGTRVDLGPIWFTLAAIAVASHETAMARRRHAIMSAGRPRHGPPLASPYPPAPPSAHGRPS